MSEGLREHMDTSIGAVVASQFTTRKWEPAVDRYATGLEICVGQGIPQPVADEIRDAAKSILDSCCRALNLTVPPIAVTQADRLREEEYEVIVAKACRLAGSLSGSVLTWCQLHPTAGADGRTGLAASLPSKDDALRPSSEIARALEEVLWDDPGLLLSEEAVENLTADSVASTWPSKADVVRELVKRRLPVASLGDTLARLAVDGDPRQTIEQVAGALRSYDVRVRLGQRLHDAVRPQDPTSWFQTFLLPEVRSTLFAELGVAYPAFWFEILAGQLTEDSYQIVVNGLPRATGKVPQGRVLIQVPPTSAERLDLQGCVHPLTGVLCSWLDASLSPSATDYPSVTDASGFVAAQLQACLREAAGEFADVAWVQQQLERLEPAFPELVQTTRRQWSDYAIAAVCSQLVDESISMRDLTRILKGLNEPGANDQSPEGGVGDPTIAESLRRRLADYISDRFAQQRLWPPAPGLHRVQRTLWAIQIGRKRRKQLETVLQTAETPSIYDFTDAASFLRELQDQMASWSLPYSPVLLTVGEVRPHVRRLVAAQFPRLSVLKLDELEPDLLVRDSDSPGVTVAELMAQGVPAATKVDFVEGQWK